MSEQRRATLTPFGKSDKKSNKSPRKTFRLRFTLSDPNENSCPVFDYAATVKSEERKLLKKHREEKDRKPNGFVDPFGDDDEDVKRIARTFEAKYGDKKKLKSYAELGAGYDETDPFIDNTDAYDEALQEDQETACGGYYINSGPLELKRVEVSDHSDADEVKKRGRKRALPVVEEEEDDEEEEKEEDGEEDKVGSEGDEAGENVESKPVVEEVPSEPKKTKLLEERVEPELPPTSYNGVDGKQLVKKKKKKRKKRNFEDDNADGSFVKTKKAKTVKALLEEKRVHEQPSKTEEPKRQTASETSIVEAIESVVNNTTGNIHEENSNSSNSVHSAGTASSSVSDDSNDGEPVCDNSPPPLPDNLPNEVMALVNVVKQTAAITDNTRKTFCSEINNCLIKLEWKTRELSAGSRNMLFAHLAHHLPCTKETLMRRAKKLFLQKEENHMDTIICKLKATIDATMPTLLEEYGREYQKKAAEKGLPAGDGNPPGDENQRAGSPTAAILPRRKFPWTDETRGYLLSIVRCKQRCHRVSKPRKSTWEEYIHAFLNSKIRPLWPSGWMKTSVLVKEINRSPNSAKLKHSSHHSPSKSDPSRLNVSVSFSSSTSSNGSLYVSPSGEPAKATISCATPLATKATVSCATPLATKATVSCATPLAAKATVSCATPPLATKATVSCATPLAAKTGTDPMNLTRITSSLYTNPPSQPKKPSSSCHQPVKTEKSEFSVDCLLKRTSDVANTHDYNTTLSDLIKKEGVIMNGASLPLINVNSSQKNDSKSEKILDLSSCNSSVSASTAQSVIQSTAASERTTARSVDSVGARVSATERPHNYTASPTGKETKEDTKSQGSKDQELLFDVMQDLKELNHLSSGGGSRDAKNTSFTGGSWSYPVKSLDTSKSTPYHNEFLNYISGNSTKDGSVASSTPTPLPYSRHSTSYDNSSYVNEVNKSMYSHSPHRSSQSLTAHTSTPSNKVTQMNQMKNHPNTAISSGLPHRYMGQMDYNADDNHLIGLASSLQYSLTNWPYAGSESQPHQ